MQFFQLLQEIGGEDEIGQFLIVAGENVLGVAFPMLIAFIEEDNIRAALARLTTETESEMEPEVV